MPRKGEFIPLVGRRFGRLVVESDAPQRARRSRYLNCVCDCGTTRQVAYTSLRCGFTRSCGCLKAETAGKHSITHGLSNFGPEYDIWVAMVSRCTKVTDPAFHNYGGRGIKVCQRWIEVRNFLSDMGKRPSAQHSVERKNNNGDYSPENCIWGTKDQQVNNTRRNRVVEFHGERMTWMQASKRFKIEYNTLRQRFRNGWSVEAALLTPVNTMLANNRKHPPKVWT